jgi:hypothetical protein
MVYVWGSFVTSKCFFQNVDNVHYLVLAQTGPRPVAVSATVPEASGSYRYSDAVTSTSRPQGRAYYIGLPLIVKQNLIKIIKNKLLLNFSNKSGVYLLTPSSHT